MDEKIGKNVLEKHNITVVLGTVRIIGRIGMNGALGILGKLKKLKIGKNFKKNDNFHIY
jgi:hypothetical protein